jgi:phosphopantetheinyl transferase (holo-ACP synthase)
VLPVDFLTTAESARAGEFKFGQPRENFTLGRLAGKLALTGAMDARPPQTPGLSPDGTAGEALERKLRAFDIHNGERGEPLVRAGDDKLPTLAVSLSHVNGLGTAVAFPAGERVGMDLELIDAQRAETVRRGVPLSVEEEAWLKVNSLPEATALLLLWTAREALGKALGCGLACQWETLALREIEAAGDGVWRGRFRHHPEFSCFCWVGPAAVISTAFTAR